MRREIQCLIAAGASLLAIAASQAGAAYPEKPLRMIVPLTPGGSTDIMARIIGNGLEERLGQPIVVYSYPGQGGNRAMTLVAKSAADG